MGLGGPGRFDRVALGVPGSAAVLPLIGWVDSHQPSRWVTANLVSAMPSSRCTLVAQLDRVFRQQRVLGRADNVLQHLNGYAFFASLYACGRGRLARQRAGLVPGGGRRCTARSPGECGGRTAARRSMRSPSRLAR